MTLKPFFTYFGGKWRSAPSYPIPQHHTLIEPFAGSAGYSVRYPSLAVRLYDLDPAICGVWDYLIKASSSDVLSLPTQIEDVRDVRASQEAKWLIGFWLNKGMTQPCNIPSKWMRDHAAADERPNTYWGVGVRARIAGQLEHIRHWKIQQSSYTDIPNQEACWFIDPPYVVSGQRYRECSINYPHLSQWAKDRLGQVTVCEQSGADWLPFRHHRVAKALEGKYGSKTSFESIWIK